MCVLSRARLFATPWTAAHQAPLSIGFSRQEYWSGLPCPPPGDLPDPGIKLTSPAWVGGFFITEPPGKPFLLDRFTEWGLLLGGCKEPSRCYRKKDSDAKICQFHTLQNGMVISQDWPCLYLSSLCKCEFPIHNPWKEESTIWGPPSSQGSWRGLMS